VPGQARNSPYCWQPRCTVSKIRTSWFRWMRSAWMPMRRSGSTAFIRPSWPTAMQTARHGQCRYQRCDRHLLLQQGRIPGCRVGSREVPDNVGRIGNQPQAKLTKRDASGACRPVGIKMAGDLGNAQWTFGALANQAEQTLMNQAGTEVYFNRPKTIEAMAFWRNLAAEHHATPDGVSNWPQLSPDFLRGNTAIIQHTTGNLTNVREKRSSHSALRVSPARTRPTRWSAAATCISSRMQVRPEREASLPICPLGQPAGAGRGLVHADRLYCTSPAAYETPTMKDFIAKVPAANVARTFLPVATGELSVHENQRVYKALTDNVQACLNGSKTQPSDGGCAGRCGSHPSAVQEG